MIRLHETEWTDQPRTIDWAPCWVRIEEPDDPLRSRKSTCNPDDRFRVSTQEELTTDGYRLLCWLDHGKVRLMTRNGLDWTDRLPGVAREVGRLDVETALIDAELAALEEEVDPLPHRASLPRQNRYFTPSCKTRPSSALVITPKVGEPIVAPGCP